MKMLMKNVPKRIIAVNALGAGGYLLTLASWTLFLYVVTLLFADSSVITVPTEVPHATESAVSSDVSGVMRIAGYAMAVVATLVTIGILATLPYFLGKYLSRAMRRALLAIRVTPTLRSMFVVKILALMVPAVGFFVMNLALAPVSMTFAAVSIAAFFATVVAIAFFLLQVFAARYFRVGDKAIW